MSNKLIKIYKKKIITVCLYYSDYNNKNIVNIFKKKGIRVITIVTREKNKSLENLYHEIYKNDYIVVCDVSSVLFYAMFLKKKVRVLLKNNIETYFQKLLRKNLFFILKKNILNFLKKGLTLKKAIVWLVIIWGIDI